MAKKEKKDKSKLKPITYKFSPKDGGGVTVKGLHFDPDTGDGEDVPEELDKVLNLYGFDYDWDGCWHDSTEPSSLGLTEIEEYLPEIVPVKLISKLKAGKGGKTKVVYTAEIDDCGLCEGKSFTEALVKAHRTWNYDGRPINGVKLATAMERVLDKINAKRG